MKIYEPASSSGAAFLWLSFFMRLCKDFVWRLRKYVENIRWDFSIRKAITTFSFTNSDYMFACLPETAQCDRYFSISKKGPNISSYDWGTKNFVYYNHCRIVVGFSCVNIIGRNDDIGLLGAFCV